MELTRRDALAALASAGILGGGGAAVLARDRRDSGMSDGPGEDGSTDPGRGDGSETPSAARTEAVLDALVGTAEVVYPSTVSNVEEFVRTYGRGKADRRPSFLRGADETLDSVNSQATLSFDGQFAALDAAEREVVLRRLGADSASPDPDGTVPGRVRYYYVNEVLFALYSSPTGGELVGIENPQGHPGGTDSYARGPPARNGDDGGER